MIRIDRGKKSNPVHHSPVHVDRKRVIKVRIAAAYALSRNNQGFSSKDATLGNTTFHSIKRIPYPLTHPIVVSFKVYTIEEYLQKKQGVNL